MVGSSARKVAADFAREFIRYWFYFGGFAPLLIDWLGAYIGLEIPLVLTRGWLIIATVLSPVAAIWKMLDVITKERHKLANQKRLTQVNEYFEVYSPIPPVKPQIDPPLASDHGLTKYIARYIVSKTEGKILLISGPSGSGKTSSVARVFSYLKKKGEFNKILYLDLALPPNHSNLFNRDAYTENFDVMVLDHFELMFDFSQLITSELPKRLASLLKRSKKLVVIVDEHVLKMYREIYELPFTDELSRILGRKCIDSQIITPLQNHHIQKFSQTHEIPMSIFEDMEMRRIGTLSLAPLAYKETDNLDELKDPIDLKILYLRQVLQKNSMEKNVDKSRLVRSVARHTLGYPKAFVSLRELLNEYPNLQAEDIQQSIAEPLVYQSGRVFFTSTSIEKIAVAIALVEMIEYGEIALGISKPIHIDIPQLLLTVTQRKNVTAQQIYKELLAIRGKNFAEIGYNAVLFTNLLFMLEERPETLDLSQQWLQGPEHYKTRRIPEWAIQTIEQNWVNTLIQASGSLIEQINFCAIKQCRSCYQGGDEYWKIARGWAQQIPLRAIITDVLKNVMDESELWRYEDVLDVLVTRVSEIYLHRIMPEIEKAVELAPDQTSELLADIWDGLNDGAWDGIMRLQNKSESLMLPEIALKGVNFSQSHLQRASFGKSDVSSTNFSGASLLLADFRSARNVCHANFSDADWYSAILRPTDRYILSRRNAKDDKFGKWCETPPWNNPFYSSSWPYPLG